MRLKSWGLIEAEARDSLQLSDRLAAIGQMRAGGFGPPMPATIYAAGRSYSDLALPSSDSKVVLTRRMRNIVSFCRETGVMVVESGATLKEIQVVALSSGWGLGVIPGTAHATVGGAFANDVHGKNHGARGSFSQTVLSVELLRSDLGLIEINRGTPKLWAASVGGLGATGLMLTLRLQLVRWASRSFVFSQTRFSGLEEFLNLSQESPQEHVVGWVDAFSTPARGILFRGECMPAGADESRRRGSIAKGVPLPTAKLINSASTRIFNHLYWHSHANKSGLISGWEEFFCPLDNLNGWNRLYGAKGFSQFQCVIPTEYAVDALGEIFKRCKRRGQGSFLSVVKKFGDMPSEGWMSFARPGITFAMDFGNNDSTEPLFTEISSIALSAGGALYPAKMKFTNATDLEKSFPKWRLWRACWDGAYGNSGSAWMARNISLPSNI